MVRTIFFGLLFWFGFLSQKQQQITTSIKSQQKTVPTLSCLRFGKSTRVQGKFNYILSITVCQANMPKFQTRLPRCPFQFPLSSVPLHNFLLSSLLSPYTLSSRIHSHQSLHIIFSHPLSSVPLLSSILFSSSASSYPFLSSVPPYHHSTSHSPQFLYIIFSFHFPPSLSILFSHPLSLVLLHPLILSTLLSSSPSSSPFRSPQFLPILILPSTLFSPYT